MNLDFTFQTLRAILLCGAVLAACPTRHFLQEHLVSSADPPPSLATDLYCLSASPLALPLYHMAGGKGGPLYPRPERSQGEEQQNCGMRMGQTCSEVAQLIRFTLMEQGPARGRRDLCKSRYFPMAVKSFSKSVTAVLLFLF